MDQTPLSRLTADRDGRVLASDLARHGITRRSLRTAVGQGHLLRVRPGVYLDGEIGNRPPFERYAHQVQAVLASRPAWAASHHSALTVLGLPVVDADLSVVHVSAPVGRSARRGIVHVHRRHEVEHVAGRTRQVVDAAAACVQTGATSGRDAGVAAMDAAVRRGLTSRARLEEVLASGLVHTGIAAARRAVELLDPRSESPGESVLRVRLVDLGHDPRPQVELRYADGTLGARVDLLLGRTVIEFDGLLKYDGAGGRAGLVAEKRREDLIRASGFRVVRVTWADLRRPGWLERTFPPGGPI